MEDINNQKDYWNRVAGEKTFTHPIDIDLLRAYVDHDARILDFGCGYGRITSQLQKAGFKNVYGIDTSSALIDRGRALYPGLDLRIIDNPTSIPFYHSSFDIVLLFAVLTCIPQNVAQVALVKQLRRILKPGGMFYVSDYYLQAHSKEMDRYYMLDDDPLNEGVFSLEEGVSFRHHTKAWVKEILADFTIISHKMIEVTTMNGHTAEAFQLLARK